MQGPDLKLVHPRPSALGLRERGKRERLRRIKEAAVEVFRSAGFEGASTREIARLADVSIGTLFVYAKDKRDLLFLVLNEDLDRISHDSIGVKRRDGNVVDRVVALLRPIYAHFAIEPDLARTITREIAHFDRRDPAGGIQARRFYDRMDRWLVAVTSIIEDARDRGAIDIGDDAPLLGRAIFNAHLGEVRLWLQGETPKIESGVEQLTQIVRVVIGNRERPAKKGAVKSS